MLQEILMKFCNKMLLEGFDYLHTDLKSNSFQFLAKGEQPALQILLEKKSEIRVEGSRRPHYEK